MGKYTSEELSQMAGKFLESQKDPRDERWMLVVSTICVRTGLSPRQVQQRIEELARV